MTEEDELSPAPLLQMATAFWSSKTFLSAVELGVFAALVEKPLGLEELRQRTGLHPRSARDFFDALVSLALLDRSDGLHANTPLTALYLNPNDPLYIGGFMEMAERRLYPFWGGLTQALRSGRPQNEPGAEDNLFTAIYADKARLKNFLQAMTGISKASARALATKFPWQSYKSFADIGCAQGCVPVEVASAHPHLQGIGYDLDVVAPVFDAFIRDNNLSERVRFQPGDFFRDPLPSADVLVMGHILHDWDLQQKKALLAKAYAALPPGGSLVVYEALIDDNRSQNAFGLLMSLNMLIETPGGFDYTGADCCGWMKEAGFRETRVEHLEGAESMVVGVK